jgi:Ni/Co efflux regulator RcnB
MRKLAIALLTTSMLGTPAAFAASNNNQQQPRQMQNQNQHGQNGQTQDQGKQNVQNNQGQQNGQQLSAENSKPMSPQNMSRDEIRQVQQALNKDGFHSGPIDGRWGHETQAAVKQFQQSKQLPTTGKLDKQTIADLGLDASQFSQSQSQQK